MADIPAGTGLGSSGSFATALLKALHVHKGSLIHPQELAEQACHVEIERLGEPIGKQDQYLAALGGLTCLRFHRDGRVEARPLAVSADTRCDLEENLVLFFTGETRSASAVLREQDTKSRAGDAEMIANLHSVKQLGLEITAALEAGDTLGFAELMNVHWQRKKERTRAAHRSSIDAAYDLARAHGALGGKLIGAGGGGFLMFYARDKTRLRPALRQAGLREVFFRFDLEGTKVVIQ
jgi:D-glycero-alpha-D-manno-heptose-7-phosphate kinase